MAKDLQSNGVVQVFTESGQSRVQIPQLRLAPIAAASPKGAERQAALSAAFHGRQCAA
jgi:hypothetical protein